MVEILIVEDSALQAKHLQHLLGGQGYQLNVARNGREALAAVERSVPGLVISDVMMPEMDGFELCRRLKQDPRLRAMPIILLTTLTDPVDVMRGLECGADNFLFKPCSRPRLLAQIEQILANQRLRESDSEADGARVAFAGQTFSIHSNRRQILNLLLSTYDEAVKRNQELIAAESNLRQAVDRLAAAGQDLESFAYSVSHDLRTPLRHIMGYVQILEEAPQAELSADTQHHLKVIGDSARRMTQLINDLLEFSRTGRAEMQPSAVELDEVVADVVRELAPETQGREIEWSIAPLPHAKADRTLLRQVFVNLIGNAIKFSRTRGQARIAVGARTEQGELVVFVQDNGVGFNPVYAERLFGVFQRLHRDDEFEGTGIGLANVRRIITRHGGRVWAEGKPGEGATFSFTLPA